jgi:hypothetical protein
MLTLGQLFVAIVLLAITAPAQSANLTRVCIFRPEQDGRLNITPVAVMLSPRHLHHSYRFDFPTGGSRKCAGIPVGEASVVLHFPFPYGGPGDRKVAYWSDESTIHISDGGGELFVLDVAAAINTDAPHWAETGWHKMWELRRRRQCRAGK